MLRVNQVKVRIPHGDGQLRRKTAELLKVSVGDLGELRIVRQSVDARKKPELFYTYTVDVAVKNEEKVLARFGEKESRICRPPDTRYHFPIPGEKRLKAPIVIAGMGPAGLFCGYFLAVHGYRPILLERGSCVEKRIRDVEQFWETGILKPDSNVQFGEGGAGTFSDGKLNTLVKDKDGRNAAVLETFVKFGARQSICYEAKPHIGTDVLSGIISRMREEIIRLGGEVRFESRVTEVLARNGHVSGVRINGKEIQPCGQLVLAIGHSARDTFEMLYDKQIPMESKAFAVGFRVEHPQRMINESQYGVAVPGETGAASYKVTAKAENGRSVYSFCMCPGGYVVNASSEEGHTAVNGMSYSGRNGLKANSAIIVSVTPKDFGSLHPLAGIAFQRELERRAWEAGQGKIPVQSYGAFRAEVRKECGRAGTESKTQTDISVKTWAEADTSGLPACKGQYTMASLSHILPKECNEAFLDGMEAFGKQISGFDRPDSLLLGVESRTSSPVRILRDESLQSSLRGLYPCGEGAGYAGGITSAAMDGIRVAEQIASQFMPAEDSDD